MARRPRPKRRTVPEVETALKAAQRDYDEYVNVTSRELWGKAFNRDQEAAAERGEAFWLGKTGPALEAFRRAEEITEAAFRTKLGVLRWVLGREEAR